MNLTEDEFHTLCCALDNWQLLLRRERHVAVGEKREAYDRKIQKVRNLQARVSRAWDRSHR